MVVSVFILVRLVARLFCMKMSPIRSNFDRENRLWLFMDRPEEVAYYADVLSRVHHNPRWYLDHLNDLSVFRVSFLNYRARKPPPPNKRVSKQEAL